MCSTDPLQTIKVYLLVCDQNKTNFQDSGENQKVVGCAFIHQVFVGRLRATHYVTVGEMQPGKGEILSVMISSCVMSVYNITMHNCVTDSFVSSSLI